MIIINDRKKIVDLMLLPLDKTHLFAHLRVLKWH